MTAAPCGSPVKLAFSELVWEEPMWRASRRLPPPTLNKDGYGSHISGSRNGSTEQLHSYNVILYCQALS